MKRKVLIIVLILAALYVFGQGGNTKTGEKNPQVITIMPESPNSEKELEVIVQNLQIPWEIGFLPNDPPSGEASEILVTERPGNLVLIKNRQKIKIEGVSHVGEGGLLGMAIHPDFSKNHYVYLYLTAEESGGLTNRVERYRLEDNKLLDRKVIINGIRGSSNHDGGRIIFGTDGLLYIATGDAENPQSAQDTNSLNGKILRIKDDGTIPSDNPFNNPVFSYGHRNPQGLAFDNQGRLWATEHGRSGIQSGLDELNLIEKGKNYGWPVIAGDEKREGMVSPVIQSGPNKTWAPSGAVFYNGKIFFAGLRGEALYEYDISKKTLKEYFRGQFGRLRTITVSEKGEIYLLTNNTDGRGNPRTGDDKLIKVNPNIFK